MGPAARLVALAGGGLPVEVFVPVVVVACTGVGMLVHQFFEAPLTRWLNQRWGRPGEGTV
jgi:peptidoglycan/LPS O-acetylase OafA/YrhL